MSRKPYNPNTPSHQTTARKLLADLLPLAEEYARDGEGEFVAQSDIGINTTPWMVISRVKGVHVYQGQLGGWFADIELKDPQPGLPSMVGTPVGDPLSSRSEALDQAITILAMMIQAEAQQNAGNAMPAGGNAVFHYYGLAFHLPIEAVSQVGEIYADAAEPVTLHKRLENSLAEFFDGKAPDEAAVHALGEKKRLSFLTLLILALSRGIIRWPQLKERMPETPGRLH